MGLGKFVRELTVWVGLLGSIGWSSSTGSTGRIIEPENLQPIEFQGASAVFADVESDIEEQARLTIDAREYWASETGRGLQAPNRRHDLRSYFEATGLRVHDRTANGDPRLLGLRLMGIGRAAEFIPVPAGKVSHREARVEIAREALGFVEWFENRPEGLEQGFTLSRRPMESTEAGRTIAGQGTAPDHGASVLRIVDLSPLVLELEVSGAKASAFGDAISLASEAGRRSSTGSSRWSMPGARPWRRISRCRLRIASAWSSKMRAQPIRS